MLSNCLTHLLGLSRSSPTLQEKEFDVARRLVRRLNSPAIMASVILGPLDPAWVERSLLKYQRRGNRSRPKHHHFNRPPTARSTTTIE